MGGGTTCSTVTDMVFRLMPSNGQWTLDDLYDFMGGTMHSLAQGGKRWEIVIN